MYFLAQVNPIQTPNLTIQNWLNQLVPMAQIAGIVNAVLPAFVFVGIMILVIGYVMMLAGSHEVFAPSFRLIALFACIAAAPWLMSISETIATALVGAIAGFDPALSWLVVNHPGDGTLVMDFTKPYQVIGQYVGGNFANTGTGQWWEVGKWADYLSRGAVIGITGLVASVTVFIMQVMLILQKLILVGSRLLLPIFIACLAIPAAQGSSQNFLKGVLGVMCWPVGWAIVHVGTMAALQNLAPPSWTAPLFQLILAAAALGVVCLYMIVGTIGAPLFIAMAVTRGTNFASGLVGGVASAGGQHAARGIQSGSALAGATIGGGYFGPAGAATGASLGAQAGGLLSAPVASATEAVDGISGGQRAVPSSRSAGAADQAIKFIKRRA